MTLSDFIQIACLPNAQSSTFPGTNVFAYASGWGLTSNSATAGSDLLKNVILTVYPSTACYYSVFFDAGEICAGKINIKSEFLICSFEYV